MMKIAPGKYGLADVRFGSIADMCAAKGNVRFTPNSDRNSEIPQRAMSALLPRADTRCPARYVRFVPIADIACQQIGFVPLRRLWSISSVAFRPYTDLREASPHGPDRHKGW